MRRRAREERGDYRSRPVPAFVAFQDETTYQEGRIDYADTQVDATTGTLEVRAILPNAEYRFVPGIFVKVLMKDLYKPTLALVVPRVAVQEDKNGQYVFVLKQNDTVELRRIQVGQKWGINWEIASGLSEGERVIYEGLNELQAGATVNAEEGLPDGLGSK